MKILLLVVGVRCISVAYSRYYLTDDYNSTTFLDMFYFYSDTDPVFGYVNFVDKETAINKGLFNITSNGSIYIGVNSKDIASGRGRDSIRLHSNKNYNHGLFVLDLAHMPSNVCGAWVAFWLDGWGRPFPQSGEIHVIEGIHKNTQNMMSLHSEGDCQITDSSNHFSGRFEEPNCRVDDPGQPYDVGCLIRDYNSDSYGNRFNQAGGGVIAMEWTSYGIKMWYFLHSRVPNDLKSGQPDPNTWETPAAAFFGLCDFDQQFHDQTITITTTFCGNWGNVAWSDQCQSEGSNCSIFVRDNPEEFRESYWLINSLRVYLDHAAPDPSTVMPTTAKPAQKFSLHLFLAIFIPILIISITVCLFLLWCKLKQRRRLEAIYALAANLKIFNKSWIDQKLEEDLWKIPRENIIIQTEAKIGAGAFADVYVAKLIGNAAIRRVYANSPELSKFHDCEVAVKVLPQFSTEVARDDLQKEINFMQSLKFHQHLICLLGYVSNTLSPLLILEYCANGDLLHFLRAKKGQTIMDGQPNQDGLKIKDLVSFSWQISNGLEYFTSLGLIHRDVAARNILLDRDNVCKIGDFGLCRTAENEIYKSQGGKLPIKWMSIESLKSFEYSIKTDVWSYGVLLFEIFTLGDAPYTGLGNADILPFLESGKRLQKPIYCPDEIYDLMLNCWRVNPTNRLVFSRICQQLKKMLEIFDSKYDYIDAIEPLPLISIFESNSDESAI